MQSNRFLLDGSIKLDLGVHLWCHLVFAYTFYSPDMVALIYGTYAYRMATTLPVQGMDTIKVMASLKTHIYHKADKLPSLILACLLWNANLLNINDTRSLVLCFTL